MTSSWTGGSPRLGSVGVWACVVNGDPETDGSGTPVAATVLVTDGGSGQGRSALAAVRALAKAQYRPVVTTSGRHSLAGASRWCAESVDTPPSSSPEYAAAVREVAKRAGALTVLAASDVALLALDAPVGHLVDKAALAVAAAAAGLETPRSVACDNGDGVLAALEGGTVSLPVVVKPVISNEPARFVASAADASSLAGKAGPFLVQPFIPGGMSALAGVHAEGRMLAAVQQRYVRTWPVACGTSSAAVTVPVDEARLRSMSRVLGRYEGIFQAQFAGDALIDVNPRVYGSLPLAVASGVNLPAIWCRWLEGGPAPSPSRGRAGVRYRWLEGDIRHVASGLRSGHLGVRDALAALTPHPGTAHSVEAVTDPAPFIARLRFARSSRG